MTGNFREEDAQEGRSERYAGCSVWVCVQLC